MDNRMNETVRENILVIILQHATPFLFFHTTCTSECGENPFSQLHAVTHTRRDIKEKL